MSVTVRAMHVQCVWILCMWCNVWVLCEVCADICTPWGDVDTPCYSSVESYECQ